MTAPQHRVIVDAVIAWFDEAQRDFPWREPDRTGWSVLVSEVMSQQTQIERVLPKWLEFMERWPTPAALAAATDAEVIRAWDRLGYPRRAVALRRCAVAIVERHGGEVPADREALLALPGIGPYTSAAIASFAFGMREPVVDTNVRRVLARAVHGEAVAWQPNHRRDDAEMQALLPEDPERATRWNAGSMELGALICTAKAPKCEQCPIKELCQWRGAGFPAGEAVSRKQPRFEGSDRQRRGRVMSVLRAHPGGVDLQLLPQLLELAGLFTAEELGSESARHLAAAEGLVRDGLAERNGELIHLAGDR
ncbi:A/G-specific adenine glycosylase [Gulosibacter macacae]|uniref:Adenine DNA glycosylase n=1 Tax=Gulosibacter macacae TaxID=2488791 RepID=A0A3P3W506_9MICO|nr:A/G-specific adenine glycosylase [Gulosibacter macacae]RRJ88729.1 A/G-specific adenine glycosylase [Gulosibacter macacae]